MVALLLPVILVIAGFSVDLAHMQRVRTELRAVADLASKAAVGQLSRTQDLALARAEARQVGLDNRVEGIPLTLSDQDIVLGNSARQSNGAWVFQPGATPPNAVEVTARRNNGSADGPGVD